MPSGAVAQLQLLARCVVGPHRRPWASALAVASCGPGRGTGRFSHPRAAGQAPAAAASSHSLRYFYTAVSEPGQGLPQFVQVGYVDDQPITHYDSSTRRKRPAVPWMGKVGEDDAQYWERGTRKLHSDEQAFRESLATLQGYHNQSGGLHTLQWMFGCELRSDGSKGGYMQFGYDGRDFLSLDKETLRWTAADATAQLTKRKWEKDPAIAQGFKVYLEETCIEWLQRYLEYGKETLQRTEPPTVRVTRHKSSTEDVETLVCRAHGFYPKEIEAAWTRAGESREQETFRSRVAPNPDGTYYISLYTDVEPEERGLYRCRVAHASLSQPLALAWEGPGLLPSPLFALAVPGFCGNPSALPGSPAHGIANPLHICSGKNRFPVSCLWILS
uniref:Ig-like domain-containing protein n=1 Tax=Varanus komodoensis TaxID=61221 RepID=A0A8D2LNJ9_VARKO